MSRIDDELCDEIQSRARRGFKKYGVTMERTDLSPSEWAQHLLAELLDAAVYVKRLKELLTVQEEEIERLKSLTDYAERCPECLAIDGHYEECSLYDPASTICIECGTEYNPSRWVAVLVELTRM